MGIEANVLRTGDRVRLSSGYSYEPTWLSGKASVDGTVAEFIPGQNEIAAAVVMLDESLTSEGVTGGLLVLELRDVGATWGAKGTVHVELCDFQPEQKPWKDRRQGDWVESHATYQRLTP